VVRGESRDIEIASRFLIDSAEAARVQIMHEWVHRTALESAGRKLRELTRRSGKTRGGAVREKESLAQQVEAATPPFDPIFPQLVKEAEAPEQKLIGFIAYGFYEEARREWASDFRDREGRYPAEGDVRAYERSWTASRLDGIRNAAVQLVATYADSIAHQLEADILRRALKGHFWRSVGRWLLSAFLFSLAVLGALIALARYGVDPIGALQDLATPPPARGESSNQRAM
jgi:hypothetical protein